MKNITKNSKGVLNHSEREASDPCFTIEWQFAENFTHKLIFNCLSKIEVPVW